MKSSPKKDRIVIALGGNAISKPGLRGTIQEQFYATRESMEHVAALVASGYDRLLITHGNGPQVGAAILRSEIATKSVYPLPMDICVADTQGGIGYMISQLLCNALKRKKLRRPIVTVVTQVEVDPRDPAFDHPTKPIGMFYSEREAKELMAGKGWTMQGDAGRGWRRFVPSPTPLRLLEAEAIRDLVDDGCIVIAGGGGGIPVARNRHDLFYGVEAVVDKDLTSSLLAREIKAKRMVILTGVKNAYIDYRGPNETPIKNITAKELGKHLRNGAFAEGSMAPKIRASLDFLRHGGKEAIITSISLALKALRGKAGTHIVP